MSPAKRLSRKRFRALCERCYAWMWTRDETAPEHARMMRFIATVETSYSLQGARRPYYEAVAVAEALARLAR